MGTFSYRSRNAIARHKRSTPWLVALALCWTSAISGPSCHANEPSQPESKKTLHVLNWATYILMDEQPDPDKPLAQQSPVLRQFAEEFNCVVAYEEYYAEEHMVHKLLHIRDYYDVMIGSPLREFVDSGFLADLNADKIPNQKHLLPKFSPSKSVPHNKFLPYLLGTTGILYNRETVGSDITSWEQYFEPAEHLKGKMHFLAESTSMIPIGLMSLGHSANSTDTKALKDAARRLHKLTSKGFVTCISSDVKDIEQRFHARELAMGVMYSGDAIAMIENDSSKLLTYVIPEEGSEYYEDCFTILADAPELDLAYEFVNFMLRPEIHAANALAVRYMCPNQAALALAEKQDPSYRTDPTIYPPDHVMEKLEDFDNRSPEIPKLWDKIFR